MERKPTLSPLLVTKTTSHGEIFDGIKEGEDVQPLSPLARLFHEPGANIYVIVIFGLQTVINPDVVKEKLADMMVKNKRFTSLQVLDKKNGKMVWVPTYLDVDNHVIVPKLEPTTMGSSSDKFVEDYISNLSRSEVDNSKPLWDVHILNTKTSDAQGTAIFRCHHSIGDGLSLMNFLLACSRKASDPQMLPTLPGNDMSHHSHQNKITSFRSLYIILWNSIVALVMFLLTLLFQKDTETPLKAFPGVEDRPRRFVTRSVSLDDIKLVKTAMDVKVNDVILGVIEAGLYRYLKKIYDVRTGIVSDNSVPANMHLRATFFFNLRASTMVDAFTNTTNHKTWGNKMGFVLLPLHIKYRKDPLDYVRKAKATMEPKKASFEPILTSFAANLVVKLLGVKVAGKMNAKVYSNTTLGYSNVPGPQEKILLFGHEVAYIAPSAYGQPLALMINVASYAGKVTFVVSADEKTIPHPEKLCDDIQESLGLMKSCVLAGKYTKKNN